MKNPPLRWIINCSIVLESHYSVIWEASWNEWLDLNGAKEPTDAMRQRWDFTSNDWDPPSSVLLDRRPPFPDYEARPD